MYIINISLDSLVFHSISMDSLTFNSISSIYYGILVFQLTSSIYHWTNSISSIILWCICQYHHYIIGFPHLSFNLSLDSLVFHSISSIIPWCISQYYKCIIGFPGVSFNIINKSLDSFNIINNILMYQSMSPLYHWIPLCFIQYHQCIIDGFTKVSFSISKGTKWESI